MAFASTDCKEGLIQFYKGLKFVFEDILRLTLTVYTNIFCVEFENIFYFTIITIWKQNSEIFSFNQFNLSKC